MFVSFLGLVLSGSVIRPWAQGLQCEWLNVVMLRRKFRRSKVMDVVRVDRLHPASIQCSENPAATRT